MGHEPANGWRRALGVPELAGCFAVTPFSAWLQRNSATPRDRRSLAASQPANVAAPCSHHMVLAACPSCRASSRRLFGTRFWFQRRPCAPALCCHCMAHWWAGQQTGSHVVRQKYCLDIVDTRSLCRHRFLYFWAQPTPLLRSNFVSIFFLPKRGARQNLVRHTFPWFVGAIVHHGDRIVQTDATLEAVIESSPHPQANKCTRACPPCAACAWRSGSPAIAFNAMYVP